MTRNTGRNIRAWREQTENAAQQRAVTWAMFERRLGKEKLTVCAINLFFDTADMPPPPSNTVKVVTIGIRRKIYATIFDGWRAYLAAQTRTQLAVTATLQRALRRGADFGRLVVELVHLSFHIWSRLAKFKRAIRARENPPRFGPPNLPEWEAYVLLFTQRRVRRRKADVVGVLAMKRRYQRAWRNVVVRRKTLEDAVERSRARLLEAAVVQALREWNAHCRTRGRTVRRAAVYFAVRGAARFSLSNVASSTRIARGRAITH